MHAMRTSGPVPPSHQAVTPRPAGPAQGLPQAPHLGAPRSTPRALTRGPYEGEAGAAAGRSRAVRARAAGRGGALRSFAVTEGTNLRIFYKDTGASGEVVLHGSVNAAAQWMDFPGERVRSSGGRWVRFEVPCNIAMDGEMTVDFAVRARGEWDNNGGRNFSCQASPGATVAVRDGECVVQEKGPVLVVSDIDGTMIGDDAATRRFVEWWTDVAVPRGSQLVYSSGRHLELFEELLAEKKGVMVEPDAYIGSVGTRVYAWGRSPETGAHQLAPDSVWETMLDADWDWDVMRDGADRAILEYAGDGEEKLVSWRPKEELSRHKLTLNVSTRVLEGVLRTIEGEAARAGVAGELIASGSGDWRYLDIVPKSAGKLKSLQYVQRKLGFRDEATLACGDSGNDILMLSGTNLGVMVGNSQEQLVEWAREKGNGERLFHAEGKVADGILEGIRHFGLA